MRTIARCRQTFQSRRRRRSCHGCGRAQGLLLMLLCCCTRWRSGSRPRTRGSFIVLLGGIALAGFGFLVRLLINHRKRERERFDPPKEPDPTGRPRVVTQRVPAAVYRRPDPMIYSQAHLMAQGIAVTWDNPDIHLEQQGAVVASHALEAATEYEVVARVWNGSTNAPAVGLPVRFSFLEWGIGTVPIAIATDEVDLAVKGAPGAPAFARVPWTTPAAAGHYCLMVDLLWPDDANPDNNLGQENTIVKPLNSPRASFVVPVRNAATQRRALSLDVDS